MVEQAVNQATALQERASVLSDAVSVFKLQQGSADEARLDELNQDVLAGLRKRGRSLPSGTWVDGRFAIRPCFINPRSGLADAEMLVDEVLAVGRALIATA